MRGRCLRWVKPGSGLALATCPFCSQEQTSPGRLGHVRLVPKAGIGAYSITSVAKPKTDVGISTPSIFAVFMFTTNSNLLD
jgi:hypothetical protein